MSWFAPSVIATIAGSAVLAFTYFYLYIQDREKALGIWSAAWMAYILRYIFLLIMLVGEPSAFLKICNQTAGLINGILLMAGAYYFINQKFPVYWIGIAAAGSIWIIFSVLMEFSFLAISLPTFFLLGFIYIRVGFIFLKNAVPRKAEHYAVGILFIIWGIHKIDYPFLRPVEWFAPWGYLLNGILAITVALGVLIIYFQRTRLFLAERERHLKSIYGAADDVALVATDLADLETRIIDMNPGAEKIFRCAKDEMIGQPITRLHPPEHLENISRIQENLKNGVRFSAEIPMLRKDGEQFQALFTLHPRKDTDGTIIGALGITIDLSERKLMEDEQRLQSEIISKMTEGVYLVREDGVIVYTNPRFEKMFGYGPGELIGEFATKIQKNPKDTMVRILRHFRTHNTWQGEIENIRKDGTPIWSYASVIKFEHSKHGKVFIAVHLDITEQKKAEKTKRKLEAQMSQSQKMEAVGTLSGGIAHEFNNILGIILGNAELAMDDLKEDASTLEFLSEIKNASLRGKKVVRQLLSFSRKDNQEKQKIQPEKSVEESLQLLRASIPSSISFTKNITQKIWPVLANKTQLQQVVINICSNAAQAMEENGGMLTVSLENKKLDGPLLLRDQVINPGDFVCLSVSDTGHGIPEDVIDHIFDPFYTTRTVDKGTGMGLAVVHGIMSAHDGGVQVVSKVKQGTTVTCYFPAFQIKSENSISLDEEIPAGSETILFVDDEIMLVQTAQRILERLGYTVYTYTDPLTALDFFQSSHRKVDLVITDMTMPEMNGDRLIRELHHIQPEIRTIIATGYNSRIDADGAALAGADAYIMKPMETRKLAETIRSVLDEKTPARNRA